MNYQRINYPNGYRKIVQPIQPCPSNRPPKMPDLQPLPVDDLPMPLPTPVNDSMPLPEMPEMPMPMPMPDMPKTLNLFPVDEGYIKGTIFRGLYRPYKNMAPMQPQFTNEKERMLFDVNKYSFAMIELGFYLDNFPNDREALRRFNEFRREYVKAKEAYENRFGALTIASNQLEREPWNWVQTTAPWKRGV